MSVDYYNLGELALRLGDLEEAETCFRRSISLAESINDQVYVSLLNIGLANVLQSKNYLTEASTCIYRALTIGRVMKNAPCISIALVALGRLRILQALQISVHAADKKDRKTFNEVEQERGNAQNRFLKRAKATLKYALNLEGLEAETKFEGQLALAHTLLLLGELDASYDCAAGTLKEAYQYEFIWGYARCQLLLGRILAKRRQQEQAEHYFIQAMQVFRNCGARLEHAHTLHSYGVALLEYDGTKQLSYQQGLNYLREARQVFDECHAVLDLKQVERDIARYSDSR